MLIIITSSPLPPQYPPEVKVESSVAALVGESVSVECRVDSYPAAEVGWYKQGQPLLGDLNIRWGWFLLLIIIGIVDKNI